MKKTQNVLHVLLLCSVRHETQWTIWLDRSHQRLLSPTVYETVSYTPNSIPFQLNRSIEVDNFRMRAVSSVIEELHFLLWLFYQGMSTPDALHMEPNVS